MATGAQCRNIDEIENADVAGTHGMRRRFIGFGCVTAVTIDARYIALAVNAGLPVFGDLAQATGLFKVAIDARIVGFVSGRYMRHRRW